MTNRVFYIYGHHLLYIKFITSLCNSSYMVLTYTVVYLVLYVTTYNDRDAYTSRKKDVSHIKILNKRKESYITMSQSFLV